LTLDHPTAGAGEVSTRSWDVIIVGGGVIGSAIAHFLAAEPAFPGTILVVERDPSYARSSTALSAGSIRQQFSTRENINISIFGFDFLKAIDEHLAMGAEAPDIGLVEAGYLFLATDQGIDILRESHAVQRGCDTAVALLSPDALRERFPWLKADDLAGGSLGLAGEGWFDAFALLQAFRRSATALGAVYVDDEVIGLTRAGDRITGVTLRERGNVACGNCVNAAGPSAAALAAMAGIELPVRPRKRLVFYFLCPDAIAGAPLVVDPSGLYFRPEGEGFICGMPPPPEDDADSTDFDVDYAMFEDCIWPRLANRVPAFETLKLRRAWAGHYAYNTFDQNAVLGPHPDVGNFLFANGFSGHGLQQSPAVGRGIAECITFGAYRTLDLGRLSYRRIPARRPLREIAVV
jgi:glycine/D-amino acid oxidase-like deaminating enzyme